MPPNEPVYTRAQVREHARKGHAWLIVDEAVLDVAAFAPQHPGGKVLSYYVGEDATDAFAAFHPGPRARALAQPLRVGRLAEHERNADALMVAFRELRAQLVREGFMKPRLSFFLAHFVQILVLEFAAYWLACAYGASWLGWAATALALAVSQVQAGWLQHDFGHLSVLGTRSANVLVHRLLIGPFKAASSPWWRSRHNRHHAMPNTLRRDPDVHNEPLFVFDELMLDDDGGGEMKGWRFSKYQALYWHVLGPPLVTTLVFLLTNVADCIKRRLWVDFALGMAFFVRFGAVFGPVLGWRSALALYVAMRLVESVWFTWVSAMSHFPMAFARPDEPANWVRAQFAATQNVRGSALVDWFTGHLDYQLEHHLFPTMPRHAYPAVHARVAAFAAAHGLPLRVRSLWQAFTDVTHKLRAVSRAM